jgi:hypothetical protein
MRILCKKNMQCFHVDCVALCYTADDTLYLHVFWHVFDIILGLATGSGVPSGRVWGVQTPPRNSEGPPKSCQTQPDCEN